LPARVDAAISHGAPVKQRGQAVQNGFQVACGVNFR
jgi:hypothetical protein